MLNVITKLLATLLLLITSGSAFAHPGHDISGLTAGFSHPFSGLDHLLAMVAVGLLAARHKGAARLALPAGFVLSMVAGALLGAAGWVLPAQEALVASSLMVFGFMLAFVARAPMAVTLPIVSVFAVFHGGAHFAEMGQAGLASYVAGFAIATVALHGAGLLLARWAPEHRLAQQFKRALGGVIAATGLVFLGS